MLKKSDYKFCNVFYELNLKLLLHLGFEKTFIIPTAYVQVLVLQ